MQWSCWNRRRMTFFTKLKHSKTLIIIHSSIESYLLRSLTPKTNFLLRKSCDTNSFNEQSFLKFNFPHILLKIWFLNLIKLWLDAFHSFFSHWKFDYRKYLSDSSRLHYALSFRLWRGTKLKIFYETVRLKWGFETSRGLKILLKFDITNWQDLEMFDLSFQQHGEAETFIICEKHLIPIWTSIHIKN